MIYGFNALGVFLGGLLSLKGNRVTFINNAGDEKKAVSGIRIIMPHRWLKVENLKFAAHGKADYLFICPENDRQNESIQHIQEELAELVCPETEITVLNSINPQWKEQWNAPVTFGLALLELSMLQEDQVELFPGTAVIILEKNIRQKKFLAPLKQYGVKFRFTESMEPYYHAFQIYNLIYLPVALANSTTGNFLSYPEGQKILEHIITEGLKIFEQAGKKIAVLPALDPRKLLNSIQKKPWQFSIQRFLPDRNFNPVLQKLLLKEQAVRIVNTSLLELSSEIGIELFWNSKIVDLLDSVKETGFYKNPVELIKAVE